MLAVLRQCQGRRPCRRGGVDVVVGALRRVIVDESSCADGDCGRNDELLTCKLAMGICCTKAQWVATAHLLLDIHPVAKETLQSLLELEVRGKCREANNGG